LTWGGKRKRSEGRGRAFITGRIAKDTMGFLNKPTQLKSLYLAREQVPQTHRKAKQLKEHLKSLLRCSGTQAMQTFLVL